MTAITTMLRALDKLAEWLLFDVTFNKRWRGWSLIVLGALLVIWLGTGSQPQTPPGANSPTLAPEDCLLVGRPWIDRKPNGPKDPFSLYVFDERRLDRNSFLGIHIMGIPVKHTWEFFGYKASDRKVTFWFPADDTRFESEYRVTRERSGRFDLKLQLSSDPRHDGRPYTYWGRMDGDLDLPQIDTQLAGFLKPLGR